MCPAANGLGTSVLGFPVVAEENAHMLMLLTGTGLALAGPCKGVALPVTWVGDTPTVTLTANGFDVPFKVSTAGDTQVRIPRTYAKSLGASSADELPRLWTAGELEVAIPEAAVVGWFEDEDATLAEMGPGWLSHLDGVCLSRDEIVLGRVKKPVGDPARLIAFERGNGTIYFAQDLRDWGLVVEWGLGKSQTEDEYASRRPDWEVIPDGTLARGYGMVRYKSWLGGMVGRDVLGDNVVINYRFREIWINP
jgi:hypothetical protein